MSSQQIGTDHSSLVATAMAENASRKRDSVESSSLYVRGKIPRGNLPNSKNIPDTSKGLLMPPQLHGRWVFYLVDFIDFWADSFGHFVTSMLVSSLK